MPLYQIISPSVNTCIGIWTITETIDELQAMLNLKSGLYKVPETFTHNKRVKEWFAVRLILHNMLPDSFFDIKYDENGKPHLKNGVGHISISHTKETVAILYNKAHHCGIDIEMLKPRIEKVAHKFLREDEKGFLSEKDYLEMLYVIWGAKEVMYKIYSKGDVDFIEHLRVEPFEFNDNGNVQAHFHKPGERFDYTVYFLRIESLLITYAVDE